MARRKTRKRRYKPRFFVICGTLITLLVVLVLLLIFGGAKWTLEYETDEKLPREAERQIEAFTKDAYRYMGSWEDGDLTKWFADRTSEEALVCQSAYDLLVEMRSLRDNDLRFKSKGITITVTGIEETEKGYEVTLEEAYKCKFSFMDEVSETQGVSCTLGLMEDNGEYKLTYYTREEDFYSYIVEGYEYGVADPKGTLDDIKDEVLKDFKAGLEELSEMKKKAQIKSVSCDVEYDRDAAKEYALTYALDRNDEEWFVFDDLGGNCQNFGSQVVYAGGVPMDRKGSAIWKYYGIDADQSKDKYGRSTSWTGVTYFYEYASINTGFGLCAEVDANLYTAEAGDIMQVGDGTGDYVHTIVSIGPVLDKDGNVIDISTVSNTTDRKNYPLSAYNCPYMRLIKIYGYNN